MASGETLIRKLNDGSRLSFQEVRKILKFLGYQLERQKGSHEQWLKRGRTFTLPIHGKDVPYYILDNLRKLTEEQNG